MGDNDHLETREDGDLPTAWLADKGKGVDPREYGSALYDPKSMLVPFETTYTGGSDFIELASIQRGKRNDVDQEERENGMAPYPSPFSDKHHNKEAQGKTDAKRDNETW